MVIGTPCSGPSSAFRERALSAAFAAFRASSVRSTTTALSLELMARIRAMCAWTTSTAEVAPERIAAAVSVADHCQAGPFGRPADAVLRGRAFVAAPAPCRVVDVFTARLDDFALVIVFFATSRSPVWRRSHRGASYPAPATPPI